MNRFIPSRSEDPVSTFTVPFEIRRSLVIEKNLMAHLPWGTLAVGGVQGMSDDGVREALIIFGYEWPVPWSSVLGPMDKEQLERLHLERFVGDYIGDKGKPLIVYEADGPNPPDFMVRSGNRVFGLDCCALTVPDRRQANGLIKDLRHFLLDQDRSRFAHLHGYVIYCWFPTDSRSTGLPHRPGDTQALESFAHELEHFRINPNLVEQPQHRTPHGAVITASRMHGGVPTTSVFTRLGFEVGLAFTSDHTATNGHDEIARLALGHDKPGVEWLLISAGAPDRDGYMHLSEEYFAGFLVDHYRPPPTLQHIKRIWLHIWTQGRIYEWGKSLHRRSGPLYPGLVVSHQQTDGPRVVPLPVPDIQPAPRSIS